jgi:site-specific DNA recombinase
MKVAGYGRVSTQSQVDGTSPEEQRQSIEKECLRRGDELVNFYDDNAFSGSDGNRPGLQKLLEDASRGEFQIVAFTKLDRLGRNLRDIKNILHDISNSGLKFICVHQPEINNEGFYGDLLLNVLGAFAEFERQMIKDRATDTPSLVRRRYLVLSGPSGNGSWYLNSGVAITLFSFHSFPLIRYYYCVDEV